MASEPVPAETYLEPEPRHWPTAIGVLAALWGGIGTVSSTLAVFGVGQQAQPPIMRGSVGAALAAMAALLGLALLVGGVQLMRRKPAGVRLLQAWIPLSLLVQGVALSIMVTHREQFEQSFRDEMERQAEARSAKVGQAAPALPQGMEKLMYAFGLGCGGVAAVVPPVVAAIFVFGRRGREALAEWRSSTGA